MPASELLTRPEGGGGRGGGAVLEQKGGSCGHKGFRHYLGGGRWVEVRVESGYRHQAGRGEGGGGRQVGRG